MYCLGIKSYLHRAQRICLALIDQSFAINWRWTLKLSLFSREPSTFHVFDQQAFVKKDLAILLSINHIKEIFHFGWIYNVSLVQKPPTSHLCVDFMYWPKQSMLDRYASTPPHWCIGSSDCQMIIVNLYGCFQRILL